MANPKVDSELLPDFIVDFLRMESSGGILLMGAAVLAMIAVNSPLEPFYNLIFDTQMEVRIGAFQIEKPILLWINDGLMAAFFLMVGLELKREVFEGELSDPRNVILPGIGAVGGMAIPALIYVYFNHDNPMGMQGWAIPAATDIAFALGILSLLGSGVPTSIKVFLTSLAIFDDIGAIIIIAIFYTDNISLTALGIVVACLPVLFFLNRKNIVSYSIYLAIGVVMWASMLKSGVHATLAGVILAMFIPMRSKKNPEFSPVQSLEHDLHSVVAYFILPVFAFANAGINVLNMDPAQVFHTVTAGVALGLFVGKQIGVFGFCWIAIKLGFCKLPDQTSWLALYGVSALCGVGFTMSLFIGALAFEQTSVNMMFDERLGIIVGSLASGMLGFILLKISLRKPLSASE